MQDKTFRRIVVASTGLGIGVMLASLAAVQFGKAQGLQFQWHWSIVVVMALAFYWNWRFWKVINLAQDSPGTNPRRKVLIAFTLLFALGLGTFLYPMRFVAAAHQLEISRGLATAVLFLAMMFWLIFNLGRGFIQSDATELRKRNSV
jgi:uncharacterized protein YacL